MPSKLLRGVVPLVVLLGGAAAAVFVAKSKPTAERKSAAAAALVVEVSELRAQGLPAEIRVTGLVTPRNEVRLLPQVGGKITYISESLVPGGRVKKDEVLVRIDARDYSLQVQQLQGQLGSASLAVEQEQAQQALAKYEWKVLGEEGAPPPLFSRDSQRAAAESLLDANRSALGRARLDLSRTTVRAPFDATVVAKRADIGQVVSPQVEIAHLVGTEEMWVVASVAMEDLDLISIPGVTAGEGSKAKVTQRLARGKKVERAGQVKRLVEQLDERTRRAQVVVTVPDPISASGGLPLLPGAHVEVSIVGKAFDAVFPVPRSAVYEGNVVWVAITGTPERLARREITIAWGDDENVFVIDGLKTGERLVTTRLSGPIAGAAVRSIGSAGAGPLGAASPAQPASAASAALVPAEALRGKPSP